MSAEQVIIIVVGPSGAGKSSFVDRIISENDLIVDAITNTTRTMRAGESQGQPYDFVSIEEFKERVAAGKFIEWAEVHGNLYGTPKSEVERITKLGKATIMDIDIQGARSFKELYPHAHTIFIMPPSVDALRLRVQERDGASLSADQLEIRMKNAEVEIAAADQFESQIVNDDFESSYKVFKNLVEGYLKKL